ncbi:MAG: hypothetical protein ABL879_01455 [Devosia sp.]
MSTKHRKFSAAVAVHLGQYRDVSWREKKVAFGDYAIGILENEVLLGMHKGFAWVGNPNVLYSAAAARARALIDETLVQSGERFLLDVLCSAPGINNVPAVHLDLWNDQGGVTSAGRAVHDLEFFRDQLSLRGGLLRKVRFRSPKTPRERLMLSHAKLSSLSSSWRSGDSIPVLAA